MTRDLVAWRSDTRNGSTVLELLYPDTSVRAIALGITHGAIQAAQMASAASWGVTLYNDCAKLNVGQLAVVHLYPGELRIMVDGNVLSTQDLHAIPGVEHLETLKWIPNTHWVAFTSHSARDTYPLLQDAHYSLIRKAAAKQPEATKRIRDAHSPGLLSAMRISGFASPGPAYARAVRI